MTASLFIVIFAAVLVVGIVLFRRRPSPLSGQASLPELHVGGVYLSESSDGTFSVCKLLAFDEEAVHVRFYSERLSEAPVTINTANLACTIGHVPWARGGFERDFRSLITVEPVSEEELIGYRFYLEAMGC